MFLILISIMGISKLEHQKIAHSEITPDKITHSEITPDEITPGNITPCLIQPCDFLLYTPSALFHWALPYAGVPTSHRNVLVKKKTETEI